MSNSCIVVLTFHGNSNERKKYSGKGPVIIYGQGAGGKSGGPLKIFWRVESGRKKKLKSPEWASKYFFPKIFATGAASSISLYYPFTLSWTQHNLQTCPYRIMSIVFSKTGCRKIIVRCRVGLEMFCPHAKWALKNLPVKYHFPSGPPGHK